MLLRVRGLQVLPVSAVIALIVVSLVAGCGKGGGKQSQEVATVDGVSVTAMDILLGQSAENRGQTCLAGLQRVLVEREAKRLNVTVSDADVAQDMQRIEEAQGGAENLAKALAQAGLSREDLMADLKYARTLQTLCVQDVADKTDEELQTFYKEHQDSFGKPEMFKARPIIATSREKAEQAASRLKKGEDFETVEKECSDNPGQQATWVETARISPESAQKEVAALGGKGATGPHEVPSGPDQSLWLVWSIEDHKAADVPEFETVRAQVQLEAKTADPKAMQPREYLTNLLIEKKILVTNDSFASVEAAIKQITSKQAQPGGPMGPGGGPVAVPSESAAAAAAPAEGGAAQ